MAKDEYTCTEARRCERLGVDAFLRDPTVDLTEWPGLVMTPWRLQTSDLPR